MQNTVNTSTHKTKTKTFAGRATRPGREFINSLPCGADVKKACSSLYEACTNPWSPGLGMKLHVTLLAPRILGWLLEFCKGK